MARLLADLPASVAPRWTHGLWCAAALALLLWSGPSAAQDPNIVAFCEERLIYEIDLIDCLVDIDAIYDEESGGFIEGFTMWVRSSRQAGFTNVELQPTLWGPSDTSAAINGTYWAMFEKVVGFPQFPGTPFGPSLTTQGFTLDEETGVLTFESADADTRTTQRFEVTQIRPGDTNQGFILKQTFTIENLKAQPRLVRVFHVIDIDMTGAPTDTGFDLNQTLSQIPDGLARDAIATTRPDAGTRWPDAYEMGERAVSNQTNCGFYEEIVGSTAGNCIDPEDGPTDRILNQFGDAWPPSDPAGADDIETAYSWDLPLAAAGQAGSSETLVITSYNYAPPIPATRIPPNLPPSVEWAYTAYLPEPSSLGLHAAAIGVLATIARRRRS